LRYIFTIREKACPSVEGAGVKSPRKMLSGEGMANFDLNSARSVVGHNVNLHLKDGSVIVNVVITDVQQQNHDKRVTIQYIIPTRRIRKVNLREIDWAERINPYIFKGLTTYEKRRIRHEVIETS